MRLALVTGLFLPLLSAPDFTGVTVEEGTKVTKSFESSLRLELVDMSFTIDGEEQPLPAGSAPTMILRDEEEVVFVDEYVKVGDGRALELVRTYETLGDISTQSITPPDSDEETEETEIGESVFEGQSVRFVWDEDDETYVATYVDEEDADEDLLDDLEGEADFLCLLSDEPMEQGSRWDIDVSAFQRISSPSGDLHIDDPAANEEGDDAFSEAFDENLTGEMSGTVESIEDGKATILIEGEVSTEFELDLSEDGLEGPTQGFELTFEIEGTLIWDLEAGHAVEFQWGGDVEMTVTLSGELEIGELAQIQLFEGTLECSATFE
ncbi:hypothetical protein Poly30_23950 [Planctomycetes bacterium Poly30]|uniref:Uncharacterized protein n=1 Tax=Saltatorellus ferox TaxID=2528018 RepID=A0A518ES12_9BACT|nr:hypothetical protein Poly30_23950 [Planctomycetes bacterium Poly30]